MAIWPDLEPVARHLFTPEGTVDKELLRLERRRRAHVYNFGSMHADFADAVLRRCRQDIHFFFDQLAWTYDPRLKMTLPMLLWQHQRDYVSFVEERVELGEEFVTVKSRDVGVTYMHAGMAVYHWRFDPGYKSTFCANKLDLVDKRGNPDSIFEKIRDFVRTWPKWALPEKFRWTKHDREAQLTNPDSRNIISGEGGDNAGRGGRSTLYIVDEAAHVERADSVNAATSANARVRGWTSSVNGNGNLFFRFAHDGEKKVFTFHWRDDPRKNEAWAKQKKKDLTPEVFAQEYDLDFGASITGLAIPMKWVQAAQQLYKLMPDVVERWTTTVKGVAGWDVGGGKAESVFVPKWGPVIGAPESRLDPDSVDVAHWALDHARRLNMGILNYDSVGVGFAMGSILEHAGTEDIHVRGVNTGVPPTDREWPDGRLSNEKFVNLKAELWMRAREAFNKSWLLLRHIEGDPAGIDYPADEVILLAADAEVARQLSTPKRFRNEAGKIMIETKDQLAKRGIASPDRADAAVMAFHDDPIETGWVGDL